MLNFSKKIEKCNGESLEVQESVGKIREDATKSSIDAHFD